VSVLTMKSWVVAAGAALAFAPLAVGAADLIQRTANDGKVRLEATPEVSPEIVEALRPFQNVRTAGFLDWSADGRSIFISTRFGDVAQIHRVDLPGGARHQVTFYDEPVGGAQRWPGSNDLAFSMDTGGSEFFQLYRLDPATGKRQMLTDGKSRNLGASFSRDGQWLAFQSTKRDGKANDVWLMKGSDPASAKILVQAPDGTSWQPGDWSRDGKRVLILNQISVNDSRVHVVDVASGKLTKIVGGDGKRASYAGLDPAFNAAGDGIFLATDEQGEFQRLYLRSLKDGSMKPITDDLNWDVSELALSEDGKRAAFVVNEDGTDRLYLLDPGTLKRAAVDSLPKGLIGGLEFSPDGSKLALTLSNARTPSDVYTLALGGTLEAGKLERWTFSEVGGLDAQRFVEPALVRYQSFDGKEIPAFVYKPTDRGKGPHPVIINIHGGPEGQFRPGFSADIQALVSQLGAVVIGPNVRGSSGYGKTYLDLDNGVLREDSVKDIGALLDWIQKQPDLDAKRVAVTGGSYGGYMVLAALTNYSPRIKAAVEIVGISNFVSFLQNTQEYRRDLRRVEYGDERDPKMREHLEKISPNRNVKKISTPLFVAQGQNDPRVPYTESEQIVREVRSAGLEVWYMAALNEGHGFRRKENRDLFQQLTLMFWQKHLLGS
jgi:dipeptidyl aminopeptidase/acylaminoacyl peptidase